MRIVVITLVLVLLFGYGQAINQNEYYNYSHYTSEMGLPHGLVFDLTQSSDGFIWIATNNGLGRFDGYNFKSYRPKQNAKFNISGKSVTKLLFDNKNNLWLIIQGNGLNRMDVATERFYAYYPNESDSNSISGNLVESIYQDADSVIWIGTNKGLACYNSATQKFTTCIKTDGGKPNTVSQIFEDYRGRIWYNLSTDGIYCYDKTTKLSQKLNALVNDNLAGFGNNNGILIENKRLLWIGSKDKGLVCYNIETNQMEVEYPDLNDLGSMYLDRDGDLFVLSNSPTSRIVVVSKHIRNQKGFKIIVEFKNQAKNYFIKYCEDLKGNVWFSSEDGLYKISQTHNVSLMQSQVWGNSLINSKYNCVFIDNMDCLWMKSERNGLLMVDLNQKPFTQYKQFKNENPVLGGNNIMAVFEDSKANIWVGCFAEGITCYNPITKQHKTIPFVPNNNSKIIYTAPAAFCEDADGFIWVGFYDGGLLKVNPNTMQLEYFLSSFANNEPIKRGQGIRTIICDKKNNLWLCTNNSGIVEFKIKTGEFIYHSELYENEFRSNSIYRFLYQTSDGIIWTGTQNGGLGKYNTQTHEFIHYTNNPNNSNSISGNTVYYIYEQSDSVLWIGTDKGLNKFNRNTQNFTRYIDLRNDFLCSVYRMYADTKQNLWLSGDCGIIKFNMLSHESTIFNFSDGLPSTEFNTTAGCVSKSGEIFFGSTLGLVSFFPQNIIPNPYPAKPKITQFKIFNKPVIPGDTLEGRVIIDKDISLLNQIVLPNSLNDFTLEFSALHFASPLKNKYWYKLEGYNNEWIETNATRRWANFTGLKPGTYIFHLKASNNDGLINLDGDEITLKILIEPPFNETWWFRLFEIVLLTLIAYLVHWIRLRTIRHQKKVLYETVEERTLELQNKNALLEERQEEISLQNEELEKHRNNLEELVFERTEGMKAALLKAEESDRLKSAFLSNMSHEIRTPMNAILGFANLLPEPDYSGDEKAEYVRIIHSNGETLLNLLNDIIDISIIESGQLKINCRNVDLTSLVFGVYTSFANSQEMSPNCRVLLELHAPTDIIKMNTDPVRLTQILNNIIGNAFKYTKKGSISIKYNIENDKVKFEISDSGIGIPVDKISTIFNRFHKIDNVNTELYRGGGLGLAISKSLTEALGGTIWAESKPNEGSTFYFTIAGIIE